MESLPNISIDTDAGFVMFFPFFLAFGCFHRKVFIFCLFVLVSGTSFPTACRVPDLAVYSPKAVSFGAIATKKATACWSGSLEVVSVSALGS